MLRKLLLLCALATCTASFAQKTLKSGTLIPVTFTEKVTSSSTTANLIVAQDVKVDGVTAIAAGTPVLKSGDWHQKTWMRTAWHSDRHNPLYHRHQRRSGTLDGATAGQGRGDQEG